MPPISGTIVGDNAVILESSQALKTHLGASSNCSYIHGFESIRFDLRPIILRDLVELDLMPQGESMTP